MNERKVNYNYVQINVFNIVVNVSTIHEPVPKNHPYYDRMIPISIYDENLVGMRYIGHDEEGYGLFEPVPGLEQTEPEHTEKEQTESEQSETVVK